MLELLLGIRLPRGTVCRVTDSSLDRLRPLERRADLVLQLVRRGRPVLTIIIEVQGRPDERKWLAWADYLITARRTGRACVLVITPSARVARWAARPFDLGPGNALRFWVLGPDQIQPITDPQAAVAAPELAFLSALAHARTQPATLAAAVASLPALSGDLAELYYTVLCQHLPARLRPTLEAHAMQLDRTKYPETRFFRFLRKLAAEMERKIGHDRGLKEGLRKGRAGMREAREETREAREKAREALAAAREARDAAREAAREKARLEALAARRAILLRLMDKSGFTLSDAQRRRVERCIEARQLDRWIDRVLTASSSREVLAVQRRPKHSEPTPARRSKTAAPARARRA